MLNKVIGLFFLSLAVVIIFCQTTCSSPHLKVVYNNTDSTSFVIYPGDWQEVNNEQFLVQLNYHRKYKKEAITCMIDVLTDTSAHFVSNIRILAKDVDYQSSTYDKGQVVMKKKEQFKHSYKFNVPSVDFNKLLKAEKVEVLFNEHAFKIDESGWSRIKDEIESKQLLKHSNSKK